MPFCSLCCESEAILSKKVFVIFVPVGEISDLGNRAGPVFHMNISKFLQRKYEYGEISVAELARPTGLIIVYNSLPNWYFLI